MLIDHLLKRNVFFQLSVCLVCLILVVGADCASSLSSEIAESNASIKVLIIELDSLRKDCLYEILDELPNIREVVKGKDNNAHFIYLPTVQTIIPSASAPANTSIYTGVYPRTHGVFSTTWFDRHQIKIHELISYSQDRINKILEEREIKTIFDYVKDAGKTNLVSMLFISKGVEPKRWLRSTICLWANSFWINFFKDFRTIPDAIHIDKRGTRGFLKGHIYSLSDGVEGYYRKHHTIPDLMVIHYFAFDIFSHYPHRYQVKEQWSMEKIQKYYLKNVIDPQVGRIVKWLKEKQLFEQCVFLFIADHGMTQITKHLDDDLVKDALGKEFKTQRFGRKLKKTEVICMAGAGTKAIYIKKRESKKWDSPPSLRRDIKPAVDLLLNNNEIKGALEAVLISQFPDERKEGIPETDAFWYFDGNNYLHTTQEEGDFLSALKPISHLDTLYQGSDLSTYFHKHYSRDSAPDIILINKPGLFYAPNKGKYGHHGSIYATDCMVSFLIGGPDLHQKLAQSYVIEEKANVLDLVPTVGRLLNINVPSTLDGKDIISTFNLVYE